MVTRKFKAKKVLRQEALHTKKKQVASPPQKNTQVTSPSQSKKQVVSPSRFIQAANQSFAHNLHACQLMQKAFYLRFNLTERMY